VKYTTDEHQSTYDLATLRGALNIQDMPDQAVRILMFQYHDSSLMNLHF
jgi:hypothetical protein